MAPDEDSEGGAEEGGSSEYKDLFEAAFPDSGEVTEDRISAFKELVHACMDEGQDKGPQKPAGPLAMLIMGKMKKKAG